MSTVTDYFEQAEIALAAYSNLFSGISGDAYISALTEAGMSPLQAEEFSAEWLVAKQYMDDAQRNILMRKKLGVAV